MAVNSVRRNGSYAPLSAHYYKDDAIGEAGEAAELLYVRGLAFCADVLSDGFISEMQLARFVGVGMKDAKKRADRLVQVGSWERVDGGYRVRSWLDWNRSRAEITERAARDAARKGKGAGKDTESTDPDPDPPSGLPQESERNPNGIPADSNGRGAEIPEGVLVDSVPRARSLHLSTPLHVTPEVPPTAGVDPTPTAQRLVSEWIERCPKRPPSPVIGQVSKLIKAMLEEGIDPDDIRRGLAAWLGKGLHPSTLPSVVNEVMNAAPIKPRVRTKPNADDKINDLRRFKTGAESQPLIALPGGSQ